MNIRKFLYHFCIFWSWLTHDEISLVKMAVLYFWYYCNKGLVGRGQIEDQWWKHLLSYFLKWALFYSRCGQPLRSLESHSLLFLCKEPHETQRDTWMSSPYFPSQANIVFNLSKVYIYKKHTLQYECKICMKPSNELHKPSKEPAVGHPCCRESYFEKLF